MHSGVTLCQNSSMDDVFDDTLCVQCADEKSEFLANTKQSNDGAVLLMTVGIDWPRYIIPLCDVSEICTYD